jgi:hypothetical protein
MKLWRWSFATLLLGAAACSAAENSSSVANSGANGAGDSDAGTGDSGGSGSTGNSGSAGSGGESPVDDPYCQEYVVRAERTTPDMLIVLDRSGSMNPKGNTTSTDRWDGSRDAVIQVTGQFSDEIRFGLMTFPAWHDCSQIGSGCDRGTVDSCERGSENVTLDLGTADAIAGALDAMQAAGNTPTAATLREAATKIGSGLAGPDETAVPKYILLVTDGEPNCGDGKSSTSKPQDVSDTVAAIDALTDQGVKTYVVGFQTASNRALSENLDMMAAAGNTGETKHRSVSSGADLEQTFAELAGKAVSCSFSLEKPAKDPSFVLVEVDDKQVNLDDPNGWVISEDGKTITVQGAACEALQDGGEHKLDVRVLCEVVPVV